MATNGNSNLFLLLSKPHLCTFRADKYRMNKYSFYVVSHVIFWHLCLIGKFWMQSFSFSGLWRNRSLINADVPSGDALVLSTCYEELQVGSKFSVEHQWSEFSLDFEMSGCDSSFGLSLRNHFTADLGREWRLVTKATEVLLTPWPVENPRTVWMLQNARPPCNQTISNSFSRN